MEGKWGVVSSSVCCFYPLLFCGGCSLEKGIFFSAQKSGVKPITGKKVEFRRIGGSRPKFSFPINCMIVDQCLSGHSPFLACFTTKPCRQIEYLSNME